MGETRVSRRQALKRAGVAGVGLAGAAGIAGLGPSAVVAKAGGRYDGVLGAWMGTATLPGTPPFGILHGFADGGLIVHSAALDLGIQAGSAATPSYGTWRRTGKNSYEFRLNFYQPRRQRCR